MNSYLAPSNVDWHSLLGVDNTYQLLSGSNSVSRWCTGSFYTVVLNICAAPVQICYSLKEMCNVHTPATLLCTVYLFSFNNSLRLCVTITAKTICQILSFRKGKKDDLSNFKLACFLKCFTNCWSTEIFLHSHLYNRIYWVQKTWNIQWVAILGECWCQRSECKMTQTALSL